MVGEGKAKINDIRDVILHNSKLKPGDTVLARWTWNYNTWEAKAEVFKVNKASITVKFLEPVKYGLPIGHKMSLPTASFAGIERWSWNKGVFPLEVTA